MSHVLENGLSFGWLIYRDVFSQKLSVPDCPIHLFDDSASAVPFVWMRIGLVLNPNSVTWH